jgi:hypothetical protein
MIGNQAPPGIVPDTSGRFFFGPLGALLFAFLLLRCAGQIPPQGGPKDRTPPEVLRTIPDTGAVRVQTRAITLEFSKYVERRSVEESIFFSPPVGKLEFDWSGKEVTVTFADSLRANTTYVVTLGTDVTDVGREGTHMASGFTLPFSTGDSLDHGAIAGRVFDEKPAGVSIFAYMLNGRIADTLNPSVVKPDYLIQTGTTGTFTLSNLAFGRYRVIAVRDQYRNLLYDREVDQYGVWTGDIALGPDTPRIANVWIRLSQEDTSRPFLSSVVPVDKWEIEARFSEPVDSARFPEASLRVVDTLTGNVQPVLLSYILRRTPAVVGVLTTVPLDSSRGYRFEARGIFDRAGNPLDSSHAALVFTGSNTPDTVRPVLTFRSLSDSARGFPPDESLEADFSEPVEHGPLAAAVILRDSADRQVPLVRRWLDSADLLLEPEQPLMSNAWYLLSVVLDSVRDLHGNGYRDSSAVLHFQTLDLRTTGVLEGTVVDDRGKAGRGPIHVRAASVDLIPPKMRTVVLPRPGDFTLDQLIEGKYRLSGFRDADSSGSYSYGRPFPFVPSERFTVYPDTVKVRARWSVEGILLRFR